MPLIVLFVMSKVPLLLIPPPRIPWLLLTVLSSRFMCAPEVLRMPPPVPVIPPPPPVTWLSRTVLLRTVSDPSFVMPTPPTALLLSRTILPARNSELPGLMRMPVPKSMLPCPFRIVMS